MKEKRNVATLLLLNEALASIGYTFCDELYAMISLLFVEVHSLKTPRLLLEFKGLGFRVYTP